MVPLPFIDRSYLSSVVGSSGLLSMFDQIAGGNLSKMSVVALGITPYISASIMLQLLGVLVPSIASMQRDGSAGNRKLKRITLGLSIVIGAIESVTMIVGYGSKGMLVPYSVTSVAVCVFVLACGTCLLSFMADYINDHFFGNGMSVFLSYSIIVSFMHNFFAYLSETVYSNYDRTHIVGLLVILVVFAVMFIVTILCNKVSVVIPVSYVGKAKNDSNLDKKYSCIRLKLLSGGVLPAVFASTIFSFPGFVLSISGKSYEWLKLFNSSEWFVNGKPAWPLFGSIIYAFLIVGFSSYCQTLNLNPTEIAEDMKKNSAIVGGQIPGKPTETFLRNSMRSNIFHGGLVLSSIVIVPMCIFSLMGLNGFSFSGTSIVILVSVFAELISQFKVDKHGETLMYGKGRLSPVQSGYWIV